MEAAAQPGWARTLRPMLAVAAPPPPGPGWAHEMKWDGVRALVHIRPPHVELVSRNGLSLTVAYPELAGLGAALGHPAVLDGEIVALDPATGRPDFGRLQQRMHVRRAGQPERLAATIPVVLFAFDLLACRDELLVDAPWTQRRAALEELGLSGAHWLVPPALDLDAAEAVAVSAASGLEGVVSKRRDAPYLPGRRSDAWRKVKHAHSQEFLVGGWQPGAGARAGRFGSLLLGVVDPDEPGAGLRYCGKVGTGFTDPELRRLGARLTEVASAASPFREGDVPAAEARVAVWTRPRVVVEVTFSGWTSDGRLRHPSYRGERHDRDAATVVREP